MIQSSDLQAYKQKKMKNTQQQLMISVSFTFMPHPLFFCFLNSFVWNILEQHSAVEISVSLAIGATLDEAPLELILFFKLHFSISVLLPFFSSFGHFLGELM